MRHGDVQLRWSVLKPACVVDPGLLLGRADGPALAQRLSRVFEVWLPRSFWVAVEACEVWMDDSAATDDPRQLVPDPLALRQWQIWRDTTDAAAWNLRWVDDCVARSQTHSAAHAMDSTDLLSRYDHLGAQLEQRLAQRAVQAGAVPLLSAGQIGLRHDLLSQDSAILSAVLDGALVLCGLNERGSIPWPVQVLQEAGLSVREIPSRDFGADLLGCERQWMRESLVAAGLAPWMPRLPELAVLHVLPGASLSWSALEEVPSNANLDDLVNSASAALEMTGAAEGPAPALLTDDPWREVSACWYRL